MYEILSLMLVGLGSAWGRESSKTIRSMPAISNSLVNLGKMDISFHFNARAPDSGPMQTIRTDHFSHPPSPFFFSKPDHVETEPCPCSSIKNFKNPFMTNPSDMINKILKSNDLFSSNQESVISTMCCDSHEHVQEDTVFFEFNPRTHADSPVVHSALPSFPMVLENFLQPKAPLPSVPNKPKAIEIFFFPKKKEGSPFDFNKMSLPKKKELKKSEIQVVGDKELRNEFKNFKIRPSLPLINKKEDLLAKEIEEKKPEEKTEEKIEDKHEDVDENAKNILETSTTSSPNSL